MREPLSRPWQDEELQKLAALIARHEPVWRIARKLKRSQSGVRGKMGQLDLHVTPETLTLHQLRRHIFKRGASPATATLGVSDGQAVTIQALDR